MQDNIEAFGGDPGNVTSAGRSAGAYAVHAHALHAFQNPSSRPLFHRIVMISNAIPAQPKTPEEAQPQFDELCQFFSISPSISGAEKLSLLRKASTEDLVSSIMKLKHHTFRPVTDELFIQPGMVEYRSSGSFANAFKDGGLKLFIGEMLNEETLYAATNGPEANYDSLYLQVLNYYAPSVTTRVLKHYELPKTEERKE